MTSVGRATALRKRGAPRKFRACDRRCSDCGELIEMELRSARPPHLCRKCRDAITGEANFRVFPRARTKLVNGKGWWNPMTERIEER